MFNFNINACIQNIIEENVYEIFVCLQHILIWKSSLIIHYVYDEYKIITKALINVVNVLKFEFLSICKNIFDFLV